MRLANGGFTGLLGVWGEVSGVCGLSHVFCW